MAQPWHIVDSVPADQGTLELRRRGESDFVITVGGRVLMSSSANRSELALGILACAPLRGVAEPHVLIGGLGMGYTVRAVLDALPAAARVHVAELNPIVLDWCRGPIAALTGRAADDPRVRVEFADVADVIRRSSGVAEERPFHAIIFDLYEGPHARTDKRDDPLYGSRAIERVRAVLKPGGVFAVWGENYDHGFEKRLRAAGFAVTSERPGRGGLRHVVYLARAPRSRKPGREKGPTVSRRDRRPGRCAGSRFA